MNHAIDEHPAKASEDERRKRPDLRAAFESVIHRLEPFFSSKASLNGIATEYWAVRVIHEARPDLSHHDAKILADAAARYFRERERSGGT